jgi:hypothetical protein
MKEKEDLLAKLKVFTRYSNEANNNTNNNSNKMLFYNSNTSGQFESKKSLEQSYIDLKDEYKVFLVEILYINCPIYQFMITCLFYIGISQKNRVAFATTKK